MIRRLCQECGLDAKGSRTDLLLRLLEKMRSREAYDKVFEKIWAASGKPQCCIEILRIIQKCAKSHSHNGPYFPLGTGWGVTGGVQLLGVLV